MTGKARGKEEEVVCNATLDNSAILMRHLD